MVRVAFGQLELLDCGGNVDAEVVQVYVIFSDIGSGGSTKHCKVRVVPIRNGPSSSRESSTSLTRYSSGSASLEQCIHFIYLNVAISALIRL